MRSKRRDLVMTVGYFYTDMVSMNTRDWYESAFISIHTDYSMLFNI